MRFASVSQFISCRGTAAAFLTAWVLSVTGDSVMCSEPPCSHSYESLCDPCPHCPPGAIQVCPPGTIEVPPGVPAEPGEEMPSPTAEPSISPISPEPSLAFSEQSGALARNLFAAPNVIGENFGGGRGRSIIVDIVPYSIQAAGFVISGQPGTPDATLVFETVLNTTPNDFFSTGLGRDTNGDGFVDTFDMTEPVPPSDAPTSPGPGYTYDGGTVSDPSNLPFDTGEIWTANYSFSALLGGEDGIVIPDPGGGLVVGRLKIAENTSPIPRDRIFLNYSMFDSVPLTSRGVTVNRFTAGFEKTTPNELMSVEMRFPFAATLDSNILADGPTDLSNIEFGDIFMAFKGLLAYGPRGAISAGLSLTVPTADDVNVSLFDGRPLVRIQNDSVHVMPFLGWLYVQNRFFTQGFLQLDLDTNGNPVDVNLGRGLVHAGRYQDETFMYVDLSTGYWLWEADPCSRSCLTGFAPIAELHYNRSLQSSDVVREGPYRIGEYNGDLQLLHLLLGGHFQMGPRSGVTTGYTVPIGNGADQLFDGELRVLLNRYF